MREINLIVVHCSATRADRDFTENDLEVCHRHRGFNGAGYHFYIRKNGDIKNTRPLEKPGAHALGYNAHSIGICYEGGLDVRYRPADTRTEWQKHSLRVLIRTLLMDYPGCPGVRTPGFESRPQRRRTHQPRRVGEGMSLF